MWRDAGLWLHPQGTLEAVLGNVAKHKDQIMAAAAQPGAIDAVAQWCAYDVDPSGEMAVLLGVFVERAAHSVMEALRLNPESPITGFTGPTAAHTSRLLTLTPESEDSFLLTVQRPKEFEGYWLRFSRDTPSSQLHLEPP